VDLALEQNALGSSGLSQLRKITSRASSYRYVGRRDAVRRFRLNGTRLPTKEARLHRSLIFAFVTSARAQNIGALRYRVVRDCRSATGHLRVFQRIIDHPFPMTRFSSCFPLPFPDNSSVQGIPSSRQVNSGFAAANGGQMKL
jgi:hypothetical protein